MGIKFRAKLELEFYIAGFKLEGFSSFTFYTPETEPVKIFVILKIGQ